MATLGEIKQAGIRISIHCEAWRGGLSCVHYTELSIDQLIQYLGVDFDLHARRAEFLARFVCERCGSRSATLRISPPGLEGPNGAHDHGPMPSVDQRAERAAAFETEFRARGGKTNAEIAAYWRQWRKDQALAAEGKGPAFIGPPNPWAHRKRGRWL